MLEQLPLLVALAVQESSVAPVALSMTATVAESLPLSVAFVSAFRLLTTAPLAGIGPVSRPLLESPLVFAGQEPWPDSSTSAKFRHWPL